MAPVNSIPAGNSTLNNPFSFPPFSSSCNDLNNCRSFADIVWSCLVVVSTCGWLSIHPNIPSPHDGRIRWIWQRLELMGVAVIAPELIILWAMRQWVTAKRLSKKYKNNGWTMTHGFLALMGGFMLYDGNTHTMKGVLVYEEEGKDRPRILGSDETILPLLDDHVKDGCVNIIKDETTRSTGDALGKLITVVQLAWFVLQCIARGIEGLAITELEIVTLGFAVLNFVTYAVWWYKPLNLQTSFPVRCYNIGRQENGHNTTSAYPAAVRQSRSLWDLIRNLPHEYECIANDVSQTLRKYGLEHRSIPKFMLPVLYPIHLLHELVVNSVHVFGPERPLEHKFRSELCVPTFYTGLSEDPLELSLLVYFIAVILGVIHLIAWNFEFPTRTEQILWRGTALMITCGPVFAAISQVIMRHCPFPAWFDWFRRFVGVLVSIQAVCYVLSRISLLIQALVLLRDLPPSAYQTVQWVDFLPHV